MRDMSAKGRGRRQNATHCINGHAYDEANTYRHRGHPFCRACGRAAQKRYQYRKRAVL
jgi:hypothetical protein